MIKKILSLSNYIYCIYIYIYICTVYIYMCVCRERERTNYPWSIYIRRHIHVLDTYTLFHNDKVGRPLLHHRGSSVADELLHGDLVDDFLGQHVAEQADGRDAAAAWSMISSSKMIVK